MAFYLTIPGFDSNFIYNPATHFSSGTTTLAYVLNQFITLAFWIAGFMMFFWMVWGIYEYILARGNKEGLAKARARIWWAALGFLILGSAVFISQFVQTRYFQGGYIFNLKQITPPK